jgi:hypothetical protein
MECQLRLSPQNPLDECKDDGKKCNETKIKNQLTTTMDIGFQIIPLTIQSKALKDILRMVINDVTKHVLKKIYSCKAVNKFSSPRKKMLLFALVASTLVL